MNIHNIIKAWKEASEDLKLRIQDPFILKTPGDLEIKFEIMIEDFGSSKGTIISSMEDKPDRKLIEMNGYYYSFLNPEVYGMYNRENFIETLKDWGYFGDKANIPDWYPEEQSE